MPFSFLMMSIVGAAGLAAALSVIPILVHLLHRQRVTPIAWGAMQFLLESPLKVRRRRKIDNLLLMLLRIGILALLAFLLCRPVWKTENLTTSTPVDVAIVLDHSMTMGMRNSSSVAPAAAQGSGTLFDQGLDITEKVSKMLPTSGTMSIILAENSPHIITPTPMKMGPLERSSDGTPQGEWAKLLQSLHQLKPGMTKGNIAPAVAAARDLLAHGSNTRKIILIISDNQRTNWEPGDENDKIWKLALGNTDATSGRAGSIPIFSLPVNTSATTSTNLTNASVRAVTVLPAFLGVHRPAQILATV
ncbi:MAG TPA: BatA domain-containing protein, partial [Phycisphaerae bacterium]